jgi:hypothetical protein
MQIAVDRIQRRIQYLEKLLKRNIERFIVLHFIVLYFIVLYSVTRIYCVHAWSSLLFFFLYIRGKAFPMVFFWDAVSSALSNEVC